jgi:hypothetical protein
MKNLLEVVPSGLSFIIQPKHIGLVYEDKNKRWYLAMECSGTGNKPGWRKVFGEFGSRDAAQKEAQRLGFGFIRYKLWDTRRWIQVSLHPEKNWHRLYKKHRA